MLDENKQSKLKIRIDKKFPDSSLLGFKIHCRGRFSRKQRASSIWFKHGKVDLNTLSSQIDYSFYSVPLRNSLCSIKV